MQLNLFPELARETRWPGAVNIAGESVYEKIERDPVPPFHYELFPYSRKYWDGYYDRKNTDGEAVYEDLSFV